GMQVLQVREEDTYMTLSAKRSAINQSDADILVSIHANASGRHGGFLDVNGTSTYYHNPFWAEFAEIVYERLLDLELEEFGVVGSFNYRVIRMSSRPAILVEQAFLSHAEDEELLASEDFRQQLAAKIFQGIADFIKYMVADDMTP
ncbi:MAG: N-acetylmuramoyl-L-alanine amidase, partial [Calditrichia bacterium]|nr:N-acetylmuramoyl-L-alanine amidase [Calditrichia bacterium]